MEPTNNATTSPVQPVQILSPVSKPKGGMPKWAWFIIGGCGALILLSILGSIFAFFVVSKTADSIIKTANTYLTITPSVTKTTTPSNSADQSLKSGFVTYVNDLCKTVGNGGSLNKWFSSDITVTDADLKGVEDLLAECKSFQMIGNYTTYPETDNGITYEFSGKLIYGTGTAKTLKINLLPIDGYPGDYVVSYIKVS